MMTLAAVVLIGAAVMLSHQRDRPSDARERLFPALRAVVNEVSELQLSSQRGTGTMLRQGGTWVVKEKHRYPADLGKVRETLLGLAELDILETKTAKPERHETLGVRDVEAEGATSTGVRLTNAAGDILAELIVGRTRPSGSRSRRRELFVRKPGDPQTWLVIGNLSVETDPGEWLDKDILRIEPKRVRRVSVVHPDGTRLQLEKETPDDLDYRVADLPDGREVASQFTVNNIVSTLASLSLEDVHPKGDVALDGVAEVVATIETFDGFEGTVTLRQRDDTHYVTVSAVFNPRMVRQPDPDTKPARAGDEPEVSEPPTATLEPTAPTPPAMPESPTTPEPVTTPATPEPPAIKPVEEVKADIDALTRTTAGWVYVIPSFRADTILTKTADLLAPAP